MDILPVDGFDKMLSIVFWCFFQVMLLPQKMKQIKSHGQTKLCQ